MDTRYVNARHLYILQKCLSLVPKQKRDLTAMSDSLM
jgi:hypothetical protein